MAKRGKNEGSVFRDAQGRWRSVLTLGVNADGSQKRKTLYSQTQKEAIEKLTRAVHAQQNNMCVESSKMKLAQWLPHWLDTYAASQLRLSTRVSYDTFIQGHIIPVLGNVPLAKLSAQRVQEFYNQKLEKGRLDGKGGISPKTLRNLHNMLHKSLDQAVRLRLIPTNPCDAVGLPPRQKKDIRFLSVEEQRRLQEAVQDERLGCAIILDLFTGLRLGELLGLKWENLNLDAGYLRVCQTVNRLKAFDSTTSAKTQIVVGEPKTKNSKRTISLLANMVSLLKEHKTRQDIEKECSFGAYQDNGFVFCNELGQPLDPRTFADFFKRMLKKAGIANINFHGLRHTFATRALEKGIPAKTVSELLGHSSIVITMDLYTHVTDSVKKQAIEKLKDLL